MPKIADFFLLKKHLTVCHRIRATFLISSVFGKQIKSHIHIYKCGTELMLQNVSINEE